MRLAVRVTPRSGRDAIEGWALDSAGRPFLKLRVTAAPADGAANAAVIALVAKALKRPKSQIVLASGGTARRKSLAIGEVSTEELTAAFGAAP